MMVCTLGFEGAKGNGAAGWTVFYYGSDGGMVMVRTVKDSGWMGRALTLWSLMLFPFSV